MASISKFIILALTIVFLCLLGPVFAQDSRIWTDQTVYGEGDYVKVNIQLPEEKFSSCEDYLIDPSGFELNTGEGSCGAGIIQVYGSGPNESTIFVDQYKPSAVLTEFASSVIENGVEYGRLGDKFGTWGVKVLVKKDGQVWKTLTTSFEYKYYNSIVGFCRLENEKTKTCEFLGSPFKITKGEGCGPNPVEITLSYFGGTHTLNITEGGKVSLTEGLITVRNMGSPCSVDVLNLRFDKAIPPEDTSIKVSVENKKMEAKIDNQTKTFSLPSEERIQIIEGRVAEGSKSKKMSVDIDNTKDVLIITSNNITAETKLPTIINGSQLYVESKGEQVEVNVLPDTVKEKVKTELDSVQSLEIVAGSAVYLVKGLKNGEYTEVKLDGTTGELIKEKALPKTTKSEPTAGIDPYYIVIIAVAILAIVGIFLLVKRKSKTRGV